MNEKHDKKETPSKSLSTEEEALLISFAYWWLCQIVPGWVQMDRRGQTQTIVKRFLEAEGL